MMSIRQAIQSGYVKKVRELIATEEEIPLSALRCAAFEGKLEIVE
jgi:hypothetical protein